MSLGFTVEATDGRARLGRLETAHGPVHTPTFMPVGTQAAVKGLTVDTRCGRAAPRSCSATPIT